MRKRSLLKIICLVLVGGLGKKSHAMGDVFIAEVSENYKEKLFSLFDDTKIISDLGKCFINENNLVGGNLYSIFKALPTELIASLIDESEIETTRSILRLSIQRDFLCSNVVKVNGFVFSRCEVSICALVASLD